MPKCCMCNRFYSPDYSVVVDEKLNVCKCVFCYLEKDSITIESEDTGSQTMLTKEQAAKDYENFVKKIYNSKGVQNKLNPSKIIKP